MVRLLSSGPASGARPRPGGDRPSGARTLAVHLTTSASGSSPRPARGLRVVMAAAPASGSAGRPGSARSCSYG